MTKEQLKAELRSAKFEMEYAVKQLQRRVEFNNVNQIEKESKDDDFGLEMAKKCGSLQACVSMGNTDMEIVIKNLTKAIKDINGLS